MSVMAPRLGESYRETGLIDFAHKRTVFKDFCQTTAEATPLPILDPPV